ncbi:MAG: VanZ family protein [Dehalococcoidia bacterium]|nr:VanZ family protein [Dehalococcoidia bacterium]
MEVRSRPRDRVPGFRGARVRRAPHVSLGARPVAVVVLAAWAASVLYGMSDELHQSFVPNRDSNWLDVGFDAVGGGIGVAVAAWFRDRGFGRATGRG